MPCAAGLQQVTWHSLYLRRHPQSSPQSSRLQFPHSLLWPTLSRHAFPVGSEWPMQAINILAFYIISTNDYVQQGIYTHNTRVHPYVCNIHQWRTLTQEFFIKSDNTTWHITPLRWGGYYGKHFIPGSIVYLMKGLCINSFQQELGRSVEMHHACSSICCR